MKFIKRRDLLELMENTAYYDISTPEQAFDQLVKMIQFAMEGGSLYVGNDYSMRYISHHNVNNLKSLPGSVVKLPEKHLTYGNRINELLKVAGEEEELINEILDKISETLNQTERKVFVDRYIYKKKIRGTVMSLKCSNTQYYEYLHCVKWRIQKVFVFFPIYTKFD